MSSPFDCGLLKKIHFPRKAYPLSSRLLVPITITKSFPHSHSLQNLCFPCLHLDIPTLSTQFRHWGIAPSEIFLISRPQSPKSPWQSILPSSLPRLVKIIPLEFLDYLSKQSHHPSFPTWKSQITWTPFILSVIPTSWTHMTVYDTCKIYFSAASLYHPYGHKKNTKKKKKTKKTYPHHLSPSPAFCPLCLPVLLLLSKNLNVAL